MTDPIHRAMFHRQDTPDLLRRALLAAMAAAPLAAASGRCFAQPGQTLPTGKRTDFDFLRGRWNVHHSAFIQERWQEFDGEVTSRPLVGGQANVDDNIWQWRGTTRRGLAVRVFDPKTSRWSIFWLDARFPEQFGPPAVGGFTGNIGTFYGDEEFNGKPVRARLHWFVEGPNRARWEQAYSFDGEKSWEPNWIWHFQRQT